MTSHSQALTGLLANTTYHYRVRSVDARSNAAVSGDFTFATAAGETALVGDKNIEAQQGNNPAGTAEAFQYTASASGATTKLFVYIDSDNTATQVIAGLYSNATGNNPGTLLVQGTIANPAKGT